MSERRKNWRNRFKGIPEPHAEARRARVREMRLQGRSMADVAQELKATVPTIKADCSTLRSRGLLPMYDSQNRVLEVTQ